MPQKSLSTDTHYKEVLLQIKKEMAQSIVRAQAELEYHRLLTYWRLGKIIARGFLDERGRSTMGSGLFDLLAQDLAMNKRTFRILPKFIVSFLSNRSKMGLPLVIMRC